MQLKLLHLIILLSYIITNTTTSFCTDNSPQTGNILSETQQSFYENYTKTSQGYDTSRKAVGIKEIQEILHSMYSNGYSPINKYSEVYNYKMFLNDFRVLDLGCGTGNYIKSLKDIGIGNIIGYETNSGMLKQCVSKFNEKVDILNSQNIRLFQGSILDKIPFIPNSFDFIMINQVFHHIETEKSMKDNYKNTKFVLEQCYKLLNKNGILWITTCEQKQLIDGWWFYQFFPSMIKLVENKFNDFEWWNSKLLNNNFTNIQKYILDELLIKKDIYYNLNGVFDDNWRMADSAWAVVDNDELNKGQQTIKKIIENKQKTDEFINKSEELRLKLGHSIGIIATKK